MSASGSGASYFPTGYSANYGGTAAAAQPANAVPKVEPPKPPKKPLTPYMRFSTSIWQQVKAANPSLSICEIGATIGRMWRELGDEEKQRHTEDFNKDKIRYDNELQSYLKSQGLRSLKAKTKKKPEPKPVPAAALPATVQRREPTAVANATATVQPPPAHSTQTASQQQQLAQAFMGLPIAGMSGGLQAMAVGMPSAAMMGMLSPHLQQQVWAGQQYVGQQQMMQLQLAAQQQQQSGAGSGSAAGGSAAAAGQDMYAAAAAGNGYADNVTAGAQKQRSTSDYRYQQSYN